MKNNKGINLIALIAMVIVMIILASIAINVSMDSYYNAFETKQAAERQQVITAIAGRYGDYKRNSTANPLIGFGISEDYLSSVDDAYNYIYSKFKVEYGKLITDDEIQNSTQAKAIMNFVEDNFDDMKYTRILDYNDLLTLGMENTNRNAFYLVNYYSNDVVGPIN